MAQGFPVNHPPISSTDFDIEKHYEVTEEDTGMIINHLKDTIKGFVRKHKSVNKAILEEEYRKLQERERMLLNERRLLIEDISKRATPELWKQIDEDILKEKIRRGLIKPPTTLAQPSTTCKTIPNTTRTSIITSTNTTSSQPSTTCKTIYNSMTTPVITSTKTTPATITTTTITRSYNSTIPCATTSLINAFASITSVTLSASKLC